MGDRDRPQDTISIESYTYNYKTQVFDLSCSTAGKLRNERRMLEESALEVLRTHLPSVFGGVCRSRVESVDSRIEELRQEWRSDVDALCSSFEEEGRDQW